MFLIICAVLMVFMIGMAFLAKRLQPRSSNLNGKHVVGDVLIIASGETVHGPITGGSSGIGKSIALQAAQLGAYVTILARNKLRLEEAKTVMQEHLKSDRKVHSISIDLSEGFEPVRLAIQQAEEKLGPVFMLVNSAGSSVSRTFQDLAATDFKTLMEMNYYSAVYATKAVVPSMVQQQAGRIVFLSSQAGQIGLFGFTAYSGAKFALRGMAEALQMEMSPHNVRVTVAFPPDTDTPGYQNELNGKPKETILISETAGLFKPEDVAKAILNDSLNGQFMSYQGLDGWMLANISAGMSPPTSLLDVITQFLLMGILRVVGVFYLAGFDRIVLKCKQEKETEKQKTS